MGDEPNVVLLVCIASLSLISECSFSLLYQCKRELYASKNRRNWKKGLSSSRRIVTSGTLQLWSLILCLRHQNNLKLLLQLCFYLVVTINDSTHVVLFSLEFQPSHFSSSNFRIAWVATVTFKFHERGLQLKKTRNTCQSKNSVISYQLTSQRNKKRKGKEENIQDIDMFE